MVSELVDKLLEASLYLRENNKKAEASELEDFARKLQSSNLKEGELKEIKKKIEHRCDVRWLGDVYIKEMESPYSWWNLLGDIKSIAAKL